MVRWYNRRPENRQQTDNNNLNMYPRVDIGGEGVDKEKEKTEEEEKRTGVSQIVDYHNWLIIPLKWLPLQRLFLQHRHRHAISQRLEENHQFTDIVVLESKSDSH